jgi:hypothetical protein
MKDAIHIAKLFTALFIIGGYAGLVLVGVFPLARRQFRRFLRNPQFSLGGLFFAFTIVALLSAAISVWILK